MSRSSTPPAYDFGGQTVVVAGGAGGIGRAIVGRLADCGASVWTWDIASRAEEACLQVDVTDREQVAYALAQVIDRDGGIDVLVNCPGVLGSYLPFDEVSAAEWKRVIEVNLAGVMEVCGQVAPAMRRAGHGRIVNMGSLAAKQGLANLAAYSAASGGVVAFSKALAQELVGYGVFVNCVTPGPVATTLITDLGSTVVESMVASSPMRRLGTPAEVAELVVWLCSEAATFMTGGVFDVSGGRATY